MRRLSVGVAVVVVMLVGAFFYFRTPDISRSMLEAKYATPPSKFLILPDGARAHLRDVGPQDGVVLVLIHGSMASLFTWEPWAKRLTDTFRVVSIDMPGHGLTGEVPNHDYSQKGMVEFTREVADKLGLRTFAIAGNSMGGGVATRFAETYPDRITQLILVDAAGMQTKQADKIPPILALARIPILNRILLQLTSRALVIEVVNDAIAHKEIITDSMIDLYWDFARMEGTRRAIGDRFGLPRETYIQDHVGRIKAPTLILWGAEDHLIPVEAAREFNSAIPGSKVIIYPKTGHIPMEEVADQSAADVRAFLTAK